MSDELNGVGKIKCRQARKRFAELDVDPMVKRHVESCSRCAFEYRLFHLQRAALDLAGTSEPIAPDEYFFKALRARIARGPQLSLSRRPEESWAAALLLTARQLVPAMAVLVLVILGATLLWNQPRPGTTQVAIRPRERVMFSDIYDYPAPTQDDVLETLVAVEEKQNGK